MRARIDRLDWPELERSLLEIGFAKSAPLLSETECAELVRLYPNDRRFRKRIDMERHHFGRGDYAYFARPLPPSVELLRSELYARLAPIANHYAEALRWSWRYPATLDAFLTRCRSRGQDLPTPLVLHYLRDGYNRLHQDFYGEVHFPLQVTVFLSRRGIDYQGGEFLLLEQRPRTQSRVHVIHAEQGELVIFASGDRPGPGKRGPVKVTMRHGVATLSFGERHALGIIFHDARS